jgi:AcrR family transcriptional regulator
MTDRNPSSAAVGRKPAAGARRHRSAVPAEEVARPDRRQDILNSAELLFARNGYHAVSVRDIAADAGVPFALVGYYFGKKQELYRTIFEHRKGYLADRIERILAVDCSAANPRAVEEIVRAWVEPVVALRVDANGEPFSVLVARAIWEPGVESVEISKEYYDPLAHTFIDTMWKALPGVKRDAVVWGYEFALGALLMFVADRRVERLSRDGAKSGDPAQYERLVRFVTDGFRSIGAETR